MHHPSAKSDLVPIIIAYGSSSHVFLLWFGCASLAKSWTIPGRVKLKRCIGNCFWESGHVLWTAEAYHLVGSGAQLVITAESLR